MLDLDLTQVYFLGNGAEDFGSDDIYEVPRPQTIFYKKILLANTTATIIIGKMKPHKNKIPFPYRGNGITRCYVRQSVSHRLRESLRESLYEGVSE